MSVCVCHQQLLSSANGCFWPQAQLITRAHQGQRIAQREKPVASVCVCVSQKYIFVFVSVIGEEQSD